MNWPDDFIHQIICGDYLDIMKSLPDDCIDLVVTDPPYKLNLHNSSGRRSGIYAKRGTNLFRDIHNSDNWNVNIDALLIECSRVSKIFNGYFWCSIKQLPQYLDFAVKNNLCHDVLVWHKVNPIPTNYNKLLSDLEYCVYIRGEGATFNNGLDFNLYKKVYSSSRVLNNGHITPKPLKLISKHILISSRPDDVILDPFLGSGTTAIAAKKFGRRYIGIELELRYCELARQRLIQEILL